MERVSIVGGGVVGRGASVEVGRGRGASVELDRASIGEGRVGISEGAAVVGGNVGCGSSGEAGRVPIIGGSGEVSGCRVERAAVVDGMVWTAEVDAVVVVIGIRVVGAGDGHDGSNGGAVEERMMVGSAMEDMMMWSVCAVNCVGVVSVGNG
jgi:hypothetical protein